MGAAQARMMDLFVEGAVAALDNPEDPGHMIPVAWVNKLNAFEREDVDKAGRGARAKRILEWERSEDDQAILELDMSEWTDEAIVDAIVSRDTAKHYVEAVEELRTQKEWKDRLDYLANVDTLGVTSSEASEEDKELYANVTEEYGEAVQVLMHRIEKDAREDLVAKGREGIEGVYRERYRESQGMQAFYQEQRVAEVFFAARECKGTWDAKAEEWDHKRCNHQVRLFGARSAVREAPEQVFFAITAVLEALNMSIADAGNSDAPTPSSGSLEQPSAEADSSPSTPAETSTEPAGT